MLSWPSFCETFQNRKFHYKHPLCRLLVEATLVFLPHCPWALFSFLSFSTTCNHLVSIETTLKLNLLAIMYRLGKSRAASVVDVNLGHGPKLCNGWKRTTKTRQGGIKENLSILGISTLVGIYCSCLEFITLMTCLAIISPRSQYL